MGRRRHYANSMPRSTLSGHLKTFDQLPRPWNAALLFGRIAPLEVEIGSGKGLFLRNRAPLGRRLIFSASKWPKNMPRLPPRAWPSKGCATASWSAATPSASSRRSCPTLRWPRCMSTFPTRGGRRGTRRQGHARVSRSRRPTHLAAWRIAAFLDRRRGVFSGGPGVAGRENDAGRTARRTEIPAEHDMAYRTHFERRVRLADEPVYRQSS